MKTALVFGANGQDGFYLSDLLQEKGFDVIKVSRSEGFIFCNLYDFTEVSKLVKRYNPSYIFNFAATSTTNHSAWKENYESIVTGTLHILESVLQFSPDCKVFLPGSGLQFENKGNPIKETDPFFSGSIYSAYRISSAYLGRYYRTKRLKVYTGYLFNHDSPLRSTKHINKKIIEGIKQISSGNEKRIIIGDLSITKEFGYAKDIVEGIWTLVQQEKIFEAVIGTGEGHTLQEWVEYCFSKYGLNWKDYVEEDENYLPEYSSLISDPSTINALGWKASTTFYELADLMMR